MTNTFDNFAVAKNRHFLVFKELPFTHLAIFFAHLEEPPPQVPPLNLEIPVYKTLFRGSEKFANVCRVKNLKIS
jgi:hypothetical protein